MKLSHDYVVALRRLREEEGGGYIATIPQLGIGAFCGDGETPEEALAALEGIYTHLHDRWTAEGKGEALFPEPVDELRLGFLLWSARERAP